MTTAPGWFDFPEGFAKPGGQRHGYRRTVAATALALGELGGFIVEDESGRPLGEDATVVLHSDVATVAGAQVSNVQAPPGEYWAQILSSGREIHAEPVTVPAGSMIHAFRVPGSGGLSVPLGVGGSGIDSAKTLELHHPWETPAPRLERLNTPPSWLEQLVNEPRPLPSLDDPEQQQEAL